MCRPGSFRLPLLAASLWLVAPAVSAVTIDWVIVGDPGNACDVQSQGCFGSVASSYRIGKYEVTNAQYAEFLNAKAASDPLALYSGFIARSGSPGSYTYTASAGRENFPVPVLFYNALRFANWLHNGQGSGDTETGAYTLLGGTPTPSNGSTVARNAGAAVFLTSENEWYKAAYYDPLSASYFAFPTGTDTQPRCKSPTSAPNHANCEFLHQNLTEVGSYTGSASPNGTFDQGGNVWEWNEAIVGSGRSLRGGSFEQRSFGFYLGASYRFDLDPTYGGWVGFRVASVPEPATGLLLTMGIAGLATLRRRRP